jgi:hypothetical protein
LLLALGLGEFSLHPGHAAGSAPRGARPATSAVTAAPRAPKLLAARDRQRRSKSWLEPNAI